MEHAPHASHFRNSQAKIAGLQLGRPFGIPVVLDGSLVLAAAVVMFTVALGPFGSLQDDWSATVRWTVAAAAAAGLFLSIYAHELGHAMVASRFGLQTRRITLFVLGGLAQMAAEPKSARAEFWIAVAGPVVSLALGAALLFLVAFGGADAQARAAFSTSPEAFIAGLSPAAALCLWLGNVNVVLALFNLIPAFPLDGGRVFRSAVWAISGDDVRATRWASVTGRGLGWALIFLGVAMLLGIYVPLFGRGLGGLWLAFIGWFVLRAAASSVQHAALQRRLGAVPVRTLMQRTFASAERTTSVRELVEELALPRNQTSVPVLTCDGVLLGLVTPSSIARLTTAEQVRHRADDVMTPVSELAVAHQDDNSVEALQALAERGLNVLPVLDGQGRCVGLFNRDQIDRWHGDGARG